MTSCFIWSQVWTTLLVVMIVVIIVLACLPAAYSKIIPQHVIRLTFDRDNRLNLYYTNMSDAAIFVFTILTNHGNGVSLFWSILVNVVQYTSLGNFPSLKQSSLRLAIAGWCLGVFVILNAYSGTLLSAMIVPKVEPVPKSLEDIAFGRPNNKLKIITEKNQLLSRYFLVRVHSNCQLRGYDVMETRFNTQEATSGPYKELGDMARAEPKLLFTTPEQRTELLWTDQYAYPAVAHFQETACLRQINQLR